MARLVCFLGLVVVAVGHSNGIGSKVNPGRLEREDVQKRIKDHNFATKSANNRSVVKEHAEEGHPAPTAAGSLTCMRWTGGTCKLLACNEERRATCEDGYCVCAQSGTCANAEGKCVASIEGDWIGEYSIGFSKPFLSERPFLGVIEDKGWLQLPAGGIGWLRAVSASEKQWKIAQTPNGLVRFTNTEHPGSVLTIYNNRRRSDFMQRSARREQKNATKKIQDDDDLWPVLMKLEAVTPLGATFQVRPTMQNGGGYELWDPENKVALASADPDSWGDGSVKQGVTECDATGSFDPCEGGKQLVAFDPPLPGQVLAEVARAHIVGIPGLTPLQTGLMIFCIVCCCVCCYAEDDSKPLIYHACRAAEAGLESRAREAEADEERVRNNIAQMIKGFWVLESNIGNFEYEFRWDSEDTQEQTQVSVRGRSQSSSEWDSWLTCRFNTANQLCWDDDTGTTFTFAPSGDDTGSGTAMAGGGQEVSFTGKRTSAST